MIIKGFRDDLPKTIVGKVLRRILQEADPIWQAAKNQPPVDEEEERPTEV